MWLVWTIATLIFIVLIGREAANADKQKLLAARGKLGNIGLECPECGQCRLTRDTYHVYECQSCGTLADENMEPFPPTKKKYLPWKVPRI